jgi:hypothetical protein
MNRGRTVFCVQHCSECSVSSIAVSVLCPALQWVFCVQHYSECSVSSIAVSVLCPSIAVSVLCPTLQWVFCVQHFSECCVSSIAVTVVCPALQWVFCVQHCSECSVSQHCSECSVSQHCSECSVSSIAVSVLCPHCSVHIAVQKSRRLQPCLLHVVAVPSLCLTAMQLCFRSDQITAFGCSWRNLYSWLLIKF